MGNEAIEVILTLSDDPVSLDGARKIKNYFEDKTRTAIHLRLVDGCFKDSNLTKKNINLTLISHTLFYEGINQSVFSGIDEMFTPSNLVRTLDDELNKASAKLKRLRCLGCSSGFLVDNNELGVKTTAAHQIAACFVERAYNDLLVSAPINYSKTSATGTTLSINESGHIKLFAHNTREDLEKILKLHRDYHAIATEINDLKCQFDMLDSKDSEKQFHLIEKINKLEANQEEILVQVDKLKIPLYKPFDILSDIDKNPAFQLKFPDELTDVVLLIEKINTLRIKKFLYPNETDFIDKLNLLSEQLTHFLSQENRQQLFDDYFDHQKKTIVQLIYEMSRDDSLLTTGLAIPPNEKQAKAENIKNLRELANRINACNKDQWRDCLGGFIESKEFKVLPDNLKEKLNELYDNNIFILEKELTAVLRSS